MAYVVIGGTTSSESRRGTSVLARSDCGLRSQKRKKWTAAGQRFSLTVVDDSAVGRPSLRNFVAT